MAEKVFNAYGELHIDGDRLPREVKQIGNKTGADFAKAMSDRFDEDASRRMRATAERIGNKFNESLGLEDLFDRNTKAIQAFDRDGQSSFRNLGDRVTAFSVESERVIGNSFDNIGRSIRDGIELDGSVLQRNSEGLRLYSSDLKAFNRDTREGFAQTFPEVNRHLREFHRNIQITGARLHDLWDDIDEGDGRLRGLNLHWKDLSHNGRQWTLIIGAIAAGVQDLSVLSSALGAGLFAVGGALASLVVGAGGAVAVISALAGDIRKLPADMRDVAYEAKGFARELGGVRDVIAGAAFQQMPDTFDKLNGTLRALRPEFAGLGTVVGRVFDDLADGLSEGSDGFTELRGLLRNANEDFPALARATGTWAESLLRGLNRANPLADQLIGYIQKLGDRFDDFTQSNAFDDWVRNSMVTWRDLGELLDATGRALNDLVTPDSIARTQQFLDNLTAFMPNLSRLLDVIGRLDVFGLAAQLLNEFGTALEPLAGPAADLADAFNDIGESLITSLATGLGIVAKLISPLVQGVADLINAMPPWMIDAITASVVGLGASFLALKGIQGIAGAANAALIAQGSFGKLAMATGLAETASGKFATSLKTIAGKAGLVGGLVVAVGSALPMLKDWADELNGYPEAAKRAAASNLTLEESVKQVVAGNEMYSAAFTDARFALEQLVAVQNGGDFARWIGDLGQANRESHALSIGLLEMDEALQGLPLEDSTAKFVAWAESANASETEMLAMLNEMPHLKEQLEQASKASGDMAAGQDLVTFALQQAGGAAEESIYTLEDLTASLDVAEASTADLMDTMMAFADQALNTRSAARDFEKAIDDLSDKVNTNTWMVDASNRALNRAGDEFDITTEKGRNNQEMFDRLAQATLGLMEQTEAQTGSQEEANAVLSRGRDELIKMLGQFGITGKAAEDYADKLGLIPTKRATQLQLLGAQELENRLNSLTRNRTVYIDVRTNGYDLGNREVRPFATGGTVFGPTRALIGEAGPEAVVPLNRPLSQVDESVRWLSAIAQGMPHLAGGAVAGAPQTSIVFEPGSIVVQGADDPRETAYEVADLIAERITS